MTSREARSLERVRPPFSPDAVVDDFAALLKSYRVSRVTGDRYAGEFPRELFRKHGIAYDLAKQTKSELFRDLLPLLNSSRIVLPRNDRLQGQIVGLERRTSVLAGTPSRIPTAATMTWRMPLPARRRSPNSAATTPASAGCRATTTATPGSASVFKPSSTAGGASDYDGVCALTHAESGRDIAPDSSFWEMQFVRRA